MRLAYVIDGSLSETDWRQALARGLRPHFEFSYAEASLGAELICQDNVVDQRFAAMPGPWRRHRKSLSLANFVHARRRHYDRIVFSHETIGAFTALWGVMDPARTAPLIALSHGHMLENRAFSLLLQLALRNPALQLLCLSESVAEQFRRLAPFARKRIGTGGLAVDTQYFSPTTTDHRLVVAAGAAYRDYDTLVRAVADLAVQTRIAADSTWIGPVVVNVDPALAGRITVRSANDYAGLKGLYDAAFFVVVPLHDRPHACGYAVISEAMACGRPVIVTATQAPCDLVEDGVTAIVVPPGDVVALRGAMSRLLDDPALASAMGAAGRRRAESTCSMTAFCARILG